MATPILDAHRARLVGRLADELISLDPGTVLDVGCGRGALLAALGAGGVRARGVEVHGAAVGEARARGLDVREGRAAPLDEEDGAVEWVVLRHVLHHLEDPAGAVAEAWRVARVGVVLAEPWGDPRREGQRAMARLDRSLDAWMTRSGRLHRPAFDGDGLAALLPSGAPITVCTWNDPPRLPPGEVRALAEIACAAPLGPEEERALAPALRAAAAGELEANGSVAVFARRPA